MDVLAIIPARIGSKGIPNKNFRRLAGGAHPMGRALACAKDAKCVPVVSSDHPDIEVFHAPPHQYAFRVGPPLHTDTCPMIDVVKDALARIPGPPDQIIVLLQPTQPLREPKHVQAAIALLRETRADSVVSVVETRSPEEILELRDGNRLKRSMGWSVGDCPTRRQDMTRGFWRDGTVYAFYRRTVNECGDLYGYDVVGLIIPPEETCPLDTPADWAEAERRLREREMRPSDLWSDRWLFKKLADE